MANNTEFLNSNSHNKLLQLFSVKPKCSCQNNSQPNQHLLPSSRLQYDLVKKCRQCRRIIRDYTDSDSEQSGSEFCECLLQDTVGEDCSGGEREQGDLPSSADHTSDYGRDSIQVLDRCESADALDESGLPSYNTAAKLGLIECNQ